MMEEVIKHSCRGDGNGVCGKDKKVTVDGV